MVAIALIEPEIPQNTGNIARLTVALGIELILVGPLGFQIDDKAVRRAGLDYWKHVRLTVLPNRVAFEEKYADRRLVGVDPRGKISYDKFKYDEGDILCFGSESVGLGTLPEHSIYIPMAPECRSINLSNAVAIVAYRCRI